MTPPSPALCGVFRFYLLTSPPPFSEFCVLTGRFSRNLLTSGVSVQIFNRPIGGVFRSVREEFVLAYDLARERFEIFNQVHTTKKYRLNCPAKIQYQAHPVSRAGDEIDATKQVRDCLLNANWKSHSRS
jgi:hypothetical protein